MHIASYIAVVIAILSLAAALRYRFLYERERDDTGRNIEGIRKLLNEANTLICRFENSTIERFAANHGLISQLCTEKYAAHRFDGLLHEMIIVRKFIDETNRFDRMASQVSQMVSEIADAVSTKGQAERWARFSENFSARLKESQQLIVGQIEQLGPYVAVRTDDLMLKHCDEIRACIAKNLDVQNDRISLIAEQLAPVVTVESCPACGGDGMTTKTVPPPLVGFIREAVAENASTNGAEKIRSRAR